MFFGLRRIVASTRGKSCCSDGSSGKKVKRVVVADTDKSHYPYCDELLIGGMSCDGCAHNVENALNALHGVCGPHSARALEVSDWPRDA